MTGPLNINSIGDIEQATNYNSPYLDQCIRFGTINEWAKYKPQRSSKIGKLTATERAQGQWGFSTSGEDSVRFGEYSAALEQAEAKQGHWTYLRPRGVYTGVTERFRFYDFLNADSPSGNGYWSEAPAPYTYTFPASITSTNPTYSADLIVARPTISSTHSGLSLTLTDFSYIQGGFDIDDFYFGIIYRPANGTTITHVGSSTKLSQLSAGSSVTISFSLSSGSYVGCVIAEPADYTEGDPVVYLPNSLFSVTYSKIAYMVHFSLAWTNYGTPTMSGNTIILDGSIINVTFSDSPMPTYGQPYVFKFQAMNSGVPVSDVLIFDNSDNIPSTSGSNIIALDQVPDLTIYQGQTATALYTWIETTGVNGSGESANLTGSTLILNF